MQYQSMRKNRVHRILLPFITAIILCSGLVVSPSYASQTDGTIITGGSAGFAWSTNVGWVNFGIANANVHVTDTGMTGSPWSSLRGWINLTTSNSGLTNNAEGTLGGYAWGSS